MKFHSMYLHILIYIIMNFHIDFCLIAVLMHCYTFLAVLQWHVLGLFMRRWGGCWEAPFQIPSIIF